MNLFQELKRRRVFRVAFAYVVAAWIVLQVADTLLPALRLPFWTVTLVAALAILGFPIALLLGWAFDLTPGGIERTPASPIRFPVRTAIVGTLIVTLGVSAFVVVRRRAVAAGLDQNAVAVLPFRVSGDPSLASLREGMVDLLTAKLTGEGGLRAIDARATLSAWRRRIDNEADDVPTASAVRLARGLGAGYILLGAVVGTPGNVAVTAALHSAVDGRKITTAEDAAPPDSILALVDRLVAKLLAQQAGEGHRTAALLSESLPAVRVYLDGQREYRRGHYEAAAEHFRAALSQDSTFALASVGFFQSQIWLGAGPEHVRARDLAWRFRERLPQRDREYVIAMLGENYPVASNPDEELNAWQNFVAHAPDRVEGWYELGERYHHLGPSLGVEDASGKAMAAWHRALTLDSTYAPAFEHQLEILADRRDTTTLRRVAEVTTRRRAELTYRSSQAWTAALALHDEEWLVGLRRNVDSMSVSDLVQTYINIVTLGLPTADVPRLVTTAVNKAGTQSEKRTAATEGAISLLNMGRPTAAFETLATVRDALPSQYGGWKAWWVAAALTYPEAAIVDMPEMAAAVSKDTVLAARCVTAEFQLAQGRMENVNGVIAALRKGAASERVPVAGSSLAAFGRWPWAFRTCAQGLEAAFKVHTRATDAPAALARLDSLLRYGSHMAAWQARFTLNSIRLHVHLRDDHRAISQSRRMPFSQYGFAPLLLERARLAARVGEREQAIEAYTRYLQLRAQSEPGPAFDIMLQAREELAALGRDSRR